MLSLHQISCHRGTRLLIHNFSLTVSAGDAIWLVGPNGVGKSTLLRVMAGVQPPLAGAVQQRQSILYLPSDPGFDDELSLYANMKWWAGLFCASRTRIRPALKRMGIIDGLRLPFGELSKGQQQRAALARLLIADAKVWLLDEPYAHLDADGHKLATHLMEDHLQKGGAIVAATHDIVSLPQQRIIPISAVMA